MTCVFNVCSPKQNILLLTAVLLEMARSRIRDVPVARRGLILPPLGRSVVNQQILHLAHQHQAATNNLIKLVYIYVRYVRTERKVLSTILLEI